MESWFIFAILSVFTFAGSELSQKISLTQKEDIHPVTNNFYVWLIQGIGGLLLALAFGQIFWGLGGGDWLRLIVVAVVYFWGGTFFYLSFKTNSPSISIILGSSSIIVSTLLGIIFFDESTSFAKFAGILLVIISLIVVNYQKNQKLDKHNILALIGGVFLGVAFNLDKSFAVEIPPIMYVGILCVAVAVVSILIRPRLIYRESKVLKLRNFMPMISAAVFGILFNLFTFISYDEGGNVGVIDALNNAGVFLVILFEILILKDRKDLLKKFVGAGLVIAGVVLLSGVK